MTPDELIAALGLPPASLLGHRVAKNLLIRNGAPTPSDKRRIQDGVEEVLWLATLKPATIGVPAYCDTVREYLEIAVLRLNLNPRARPTRLVELVHRAIPYPVLLITLHAGALSLSAAHKRWAENEKARTVLDGGVCSLSPASLAPQLLPAFTRALALALQPRASMLHLYQGWLHLFVATRVAAITGSLVLPDSQQTAAAWLAALHQDSQLAAEAARLRALAARESQLPRQVDYNLAVQRIAAERKRLHAGFGLNPPKEPAS